MTNNVSGGGRYIAIDGLRGLATVAIACVYHLRTMPYIYPTGLPFESIGIMSWIYRRGGIFVELFLAVSGFSFFTAYTERIDDGMSFSRYGMRRVIRIYPLMIATLLIVEVEQLLYIKCFGEGFWMGGDNTLTMIVLSTLGLQMFYPGPQSWNKPAWSLSVFFVCWVIYYILIAVTKKRENKDAIRILVCIAMILIGVGIQENPPEVQIALINLNVARGYISFFGGGLVYYIHKVTKTHSRKTILLSAAVLLWLFFLRYMGVEVGIFTVVFGMAIYPSVLLLALKSTLVQRISAFPVFTYLGKISFSIYLCNFPIELAIAIADKQFALNINYSSTLFFFSFFAVHIIVGSFFYLIFEKKIPSIIKMRLNT